MITYNGNVLSIQSREGTCSTVIGCRFVLNRGVVSDRTVVSGNRGRNIPPVHKVFFGDSTNRFVTNQTKFVLLLNRAT